MLEILNKEYKQAGEIRLGLTSEEAAERLKANGANALAVAKKAQPLKIFLGQFKDVMVLILLAATAVSVLLGEVYDAITIILIVLINAILGFVQEFRTEKTLEALKAMTAPTARCYRDGRSVVIPAAELVVGDVVELEAGDRVPADCTLTFCKGLFADEAILTGEAIPVEKILQQKVYSGTVITKGRGTARVVATGMESEMGQISNMLSTIEQPQTPLQKRLGELGRIVAILCVVVCIVVFGAGVLRGEAIFAMLLTGISIAIAAIPEGLPATVTIALALAVSRMLRQKALVSKLHSVETLGCTSVICSDKTGTITENRMTVRKIYTMGNIYDVLGSGYRISGEILDGENRVNPTANRALTELFRSGVLCNNAAISTTSDLSTRDRGRLSTAGEWDVIGDPTEIALLVAAAKGGVFERDLKREFAKLDEIPFDSETRAMTVVVMGKSGEKTAYTKGAPDVVIEHCSYIEDVSGHLVTLSHAMRREILAAQDSMTGGALRVLAFAKKTVKGATDSSIGMVFLGLMGSFDPPRAEAKRAIAICKRARIKTVMITGDHKNTAVAIARQAGILQGIGGTKEDSVMTGAELALLSDEQLAARIEKIRVFARVNPADKLRIVRAFKACGEIVTMTGDGVNDAPAIKEAHIGVAMGITGTDVTKGAADVILLDDNFATLVNAVREGRTIYANIRKFVRYLLSCNIGEVITMFVGILMGLPLILLPTQILLVNLVTDGLPAVALGVEPVEEALMKQPPRPPNEGFFSGGLMWKIVLRGIMIGGFTLLCFVVTMRLSGSVETARTAALLTLVASQLLHVFECKSERKNIFTVPYLSNPRLLLAVLASAIVIMLAIYFPPLQQILDTVALTGKQLLVALGFSAVAPIISAFLGKKR